MWWFRGEWFWTGLGCALAIPTFVVVYIIAHFLINAIFLFFQN